MARNFGCNNPPLTVFDPSGAQVMTVGVQPDGTYGMVVRDAAGHPLIYLGMLPEGTHGLLIQDANAQPLLKVTSEFGQTYPRNSVTPIASGPNSVVSGTANSMRPGTSNAGFTEVWRGDFFSTGAKVDYDLTPCANAGNADWRILCYEIGATPVVVVGPNNETTNVQRSGTFTIPASGLAGGGTDPAGRNMTVRVEIRKNSGATTVDMAANGPFINHA